MKLKLTVLMGLMFLLLIGTGCSGSYEGKTTGIKYILSEGFAKEFPGQSQDPQKVNREDSREGNQETGSEVSNGVGGDISSRTGNEVSIGTGSEASDKVSNEYEVSNKILNEVNQQVYEGINREVNQGVYDEVYQSFPVKLPSEVSTVNKTVYLTFDDGPNNSETLMVLDILDSYQVKGTFFVIGTNIQHYPAVLKDIISRGHAVGNHTYDHKYSEVYASNDAFLESIKKNEELIFKTGGIRPKIVRDPGGQVRNNKVVKDLLAQNGYTLVDWNIDSYDSRKPSLDGAQILESVRRQVAKPSIGSEAIILMHDGTGHMNTVRALPTIIEMLKIQGFRFATLQ